MGADNTMTKSRDYFFKCELRIIAPLQGVKILITEKNRGVCIFLGYSRELASVSSSALVAGFGQSLANGEE